MKFRWIAFGLATVFTLGAATASAYVEFPTEALFVEKKEVSFSAVTGQDMKLSCDDIEFRLGLDSGSLRGLTVTGLPAEQEGVFLLDGVPVALYQELSREEIDRTVFQSGTSDSAKMTFLPDAGQSVQTTMSVSVSQTLNLPPVAQDGSFSTEKNIPVESKVTVYDPEGDQVRVQVLQAPKKGCLRFDGIYFRYEPFRDMVGSDCFTFTVVDKSGNYSEQRRIDIVIEDSASGFRYTDMVGNPSHYSAIKLAENGIVTGEQAGNSYFFRPEDQLERGDFLVMLLAAAGYEGELAPCVNTGLTNDSALPAWLKPYVRLGLDKGILSGDSFGYEEIPTRAEAAVMVSGAAGMEDVTRSSIDLGDREQIPSWAVQDYLNLLGYRMLDLYDGCAHPNDPLTRDHAADLLWQSVKYRQKYR